MASYEKMKCVELKALLKRYDIKNRSKITTKLAMVTALTSHLESKGNVSIEISDIELSGKTAVNRKDKLNETVYDVKSSEINVIGKHLVPKEIFCGEVDNTTPETTCSSTKNCKVDVSDPKDTGAQIYHISSKETDLETGLKILGSNRKETSIENLITNSVRKKKDFKGDPKWKNFFDNLPMKDGCIDNKLLVEQKKSSLIKDIRPDLSEQLKSEDNQGIDIGKIKYGSNKQLKWTCYCGHKWLALVSRRTTYKTVCCPKCSEKEKLTIEKCQKHVESKGQCLSTEYINNNTKMLWKCNCGHKWEACFANIKNKGGWCPKCARKLLLTLEECQKYAEERGGSCLSKKYINTGEKMEWKCNCGHRWEACFDNIKNKGKWCPKCAGNARLTLEECQKYAEERGGSCLSEEYINTREAIKWRCSCGHEWETSFGNMKQKNTWCPKCAGMSSPTSEEAELKYLNSGFELKEKYLNNKKPHVVICLTCKQKTTKAYTSLGRSGCFKCVKDRLESIGASGVRTVLKLFNINPRCEWDARLPSIKYGKIRYDFMFEYGGRNFIIEFDGEQHFKFIPGWYKDEKDFLRRQEIDRMKNYAALKSGYSVIRISKKDKVEIQVFIWYCLHKLSDEPFLEVDDGECYKYQTDVNVSRETVMKYCPSLLEATG